MVNKLLLAEDKFKSEMHLRLDLHIVLLVHSLKIKAE